MMNKLQVTFELEHPSGGDVIVQLLGSSKMSVPFGGGLVTGTHVVPLTNFPLHASRKL